MSELVKELRQFNHDKAADAIEAVLALHKPIKVYNECDCPDGTHPEEYEWIDCEDYVGCENSFSHYACEECCTAWDNITEGCSETHSHARALDTRCPTVAALQ